MCDALYGRYALWTVSGETARILEPALREGGVKQAAPGDKAARSVKVVSGSCTNVAGGTSTEVRPRARSRVSG